MGGHPAPHADPNEFGPRSGPSGGHSAPHADSDQFGPRGHAGGPPTPPPPNRQMGGHPAPHTDPSEFGPRPGATPHVDSDQFGPRGHAGPPTPPPPNRQPGPHPPAAGPGPEPREVGQRSMPAHPRPGMDTGARPIPGPSEPGSDAHLSPAPQSSAPRRVPVVPLPPPRQPNEDDPIGMTAEMEVIGEEVQKRREIDHTLARFSAVHDELKAEERERKAKRRKLMPWQSTDDELDRLDELVGMQTMAVPLREHQQERPEPAEVDSPPPTRLQAKKNRRKNRSTLAGKVFAATAAILVFAATGAAWGFKSWIDSNSQQVDALDPDSAAIQDAAAQRGDENFLLVGSDTRAGADSEEGVGDESAVGGARSDTVMIAHVPKNRERAVIVSFPRDLEVTRPACEGWDAKTGEYTGDQHPPAEQVKINTAYQVGGPKCVTKMVQELSGIAINHFVGIDFHGFKDMVDAVHGVQVCVERPMVDEELGTVVPEAGKNVTLSGDQALNFVRARKVEGDPTSDYGRITRQQRFLSSLLRKAMSTEVLLDPKKLTGFVKAFAKSTFGDNIGVDQLFVLGQSMQGIEAGRVTFVTVPTVGEANERGNEDLLTDDTKALFDAIRKDGALPGEAPKKQDDQQTEESDDSNLAAGVAQQGGTVDPATVKLQVLNGGNPIEGIAGETADELADIGFEIMQVAAAPENVDRTIIKYAKERQAQAQTVAAAVPDAELVEDPSMAGAIMLVIGPGFDSEVVAPAGGGQAPADLPDNLSTVNASDVSCA